MKYRQTLAALGGQPDRPAKPPRRMPPCPAPRLGASALEAAFTAVFGQFAPATRARHLSALRSTLAWWAEAGWVTSDPAAG